MDLPAVVDDNQEIYLTNADLVAKSEMQDVQYAYTADRIELRLGSFEPGGPGGGPQIQEGEAQVDGATRGGARGALDSASEPNDSASSPAPVVEGSLPVLSELPGYRVPPDFFQAYALFPATGSVFTQADMESGSRLLVLGSELAKNLFEDGESFGREIVAQRQLYTISGLLEPTGTEMDFMAFVPDTLIEQGAIPQDFRSFLNTTLHFTVFESESLDEAKAQLTEWFDQKYGTDLVTISIPREEAEAARDRNSRLVTVVLFLAFSGLLIASVNVSNILLGRAMRKRKVVGVLKALGARIRDVFGLFFFESFVIGASGALLGAGVSLVISRLMNAAILDGAFVSGMLIVGILGAWAVTTALTIIPALQASRIPAAEALRYE